MASDAYRSALQSTGMFEVKQLKIANQTQEYVKNLQKQKLSYADMNKARIVGEAAYQEQLRLSQASVATFRRDAQGNILADLAVPKTVSKDLDTVGNRMSWIGEQTSSAARQMVNWGKNTQWAGRQLMVGFTMPVAAFGAVAGTLAYQADKELTRIAKVYDTKASEQIAKDKELAGVRTQSMDMARESAQKYGAAMNDTLDAEAQLAATGLRGQNLMDRTNQVMRIATLGELDYNDAVNASIALQSVFRLSTTQTAEAFDYMNAMENATNLSTQDFAQAIPIAAAPIQAMGGDVKQLGEFLAAMKERGIAATEGANAIKAAMQRLYRPSQQIREEWEAITHTDLSEIRDRNKGNIKGMLSDIADATDTLGRAEKIQVLGGLFGTYQVTRLNALIEGIHDMENGLGQAATAADIGAMSVEQLADIAEQELGRRAVSASGQFKSALETLKVDLAELGEVFLTVGTKFLKVASGIVGFINDLPSGIKSALAMVAIFTALVGPVIMLAGLFVNLVGNLRLARGAFLKMFGTLNIMTEEEHLAAAAAKGLTNTLVDQGRAADIVSAQVQGLAQSYGIAETAMRRYSGLGGKHIGGPTVVGGAPAAAGKHVAIVPTKAADDAERVAKAGDTAKRSWMGAAGAIATGVGALGLMVDDGEGASAVFSNVLFSAMLLGPAFGAAGRALGPMITSIKTARLEMGILSALTSGLGKGFVASALSVGGIGLGLGAAYGFYKLALDQQKKSIEEQANLNASTKNWADHLGLVWKEYKDIKSTSKEIAVPDTTTVTDWASALKDADATLYDAMKNAGSLADAQALAMRVATESLLHGIDTKEVRKQVDTLFYVYGEDVNEASKQTDELMRSLEGKSTRSIQDSQLVSYWRTFADNIQEGMSKDAMKEFGSGVGDQIWEGLKASAKQSPAAAAEYMESVSDSFSSALDQVFEDMNMDEVTADMFSTLGIDSGGELYEAWKDFMNMLPEDWAAKWANGDEGMRQTFETLVAMQEQMPAIENGQQGIVDAIAKQAGLTGEYNSLLEVQNALVQAGLVAEGSRKEIIEGYRDAIRGSTGEYQNGVWIAQKMNDEEKLMLLNSARRELGLRETNNLADGFRNITKDSNAELAKGTTEIQRQKQAADARNKAFNEWQAGGGYQDLARGGMEAASAAVGETMMDNFEAEQEQAMDQIEANGEARLQALDDERERRLKQYDREQRELDRNQEKELRRFEEAWEDRTKAVERSYDRRINRVQAAIDAEQEAEDQRQRMFEAEQERVDRMAEMANQNIDFNMAINSGDFDEAAKIRNDMEATQSGWENDDAAEEAGRKSERTIKRLNKLLEKINKSREKRLEVLQDLEDAQRKALEREQEREDRALERERDRYQERMDMQREMIENQIESTRDAAEKEFDIRRKNLEQAIKMIESYTGTSQKDLREYMRKVGLEYNEFDTQLKNRGVEWGEIIGNALTNNVREAANKIRSDINWAGISRSAAQEMVRGAFGMDLGQFKRWLGLSMGGGKAGGGGHHGHGGGGDGGNDGVTSPGIQQYHTGGVIGEDRGGRTGFAGGKSPQEVPFLGLKGEGVVNRKGMQALGREGLNALNRGTGPGDDRSHTGGIGLGHTGVMGAVMAAVIQSGFQAGLTKAKEMRAAQQASRGDGTYLPGKPGVYGESGVHFDRTQLRNAALIASIGAKAGFSERDQMIAIMASLAESKLYNLHGGDRDSQGLFQQRPSQGWGTVEQVTNPELATRAFYGIAKHTNNTGLKDIHGRDSMTPWMAAQSVQRSYSDTGANYHVWWDEAQDILKGLRYQALAEGLPGAVKNAYPLPGVKPWVDEAAEYLGQKYNVKTIYGVGQRSNVSDHPKGLALDFMVYGNKKKGDQIAADAVRMQKALDVKYVIWRQRINSLDGRGWRHMEDRGSPTANHMDHVHVSFDSSGDIDHLLQTGQAGEMGGSNQGHGPGPGRGDKSLPVRSIHITQGLHDTQYEFPGIDLDGVKGTDIFSVRPGHVDVSKDLISGGGYYSYGRYIVLDHGKDRTLYAHLSKRLVRAGQNVPAGAHIGEMGETGHADGTHLHFGATPSSPYRFIHLRKGAELINKDNTIANLHAGETVLTKGLSQQFREGMQNFASAGNTEYNGSTTVNVYPSPGMDEGAFAEKVVRIIERKQAQDRGRRVRR